MCDSCTYVLCACLYTFFKHGMYVYVHTSVYPMHLFDLTRPPSPVAGAADTMAAVQNADGRRGEAPGRKDSAFQSTAGFVSSTAKAAEEEEEEEEEEDPRRGDLFAAAAGIVHHHSKMNWAPCHCLGLPRPTTEEEACRYRRQERQGWQGWHQPGPLPSPCVVQTMKVVDNIDGNAFELRRAPPPSRVLSSWTPATVGRGLRTSCWCGVACGLLE